MADNAAQPQTFHVRALRYQVPVESDEYPDIDGAVRLAEYWLWEGHSAQQEIWSGDRLVLDHEATIQHMLG